MLLIRRAQESDAASLTVVHVAAIREVCSAVYSAEQIEAWASSKRPERYLAPIAHNPFFVAELDGSVVGFAHFVAATGEVRAVYVRPDQLRRGIGRSLLSTLEDCARELGLARLELQSSLNAVAFYLAQGYVAGAMLSVTLAPGLELACTPMHKLL